MWLWEVGVWQWLPLWQEYLNNFPFIYKMVFRPILVKLCLYGNIHILESYMHDLHIELLNPSRYSIMDLQSIQWQFQKTLRTCCFCTSESGCIGPILLLTLQPTLIAPQGILLMLSLLMMSNLWGNNEILFSNWNGAIFLEFSDARNNLLFYGTWDYWQDCDYTDLFLMASLRGSIHGVSSDRLVGTLQSSTVEFP